MNSDVILTLVVVANEIDDWTLGRVTTRRFAIDTFRITRPLCPLR